MLLLWLVLLLMVFGMFLLRAHRKLPRVIYIPCSLLCSLLLQVPKAQLILLFNIEVAKPSITDPCSTQLTVQLHIEAAALLHGLL